MTKNINELVKQDLKKLKKEFVLTKTPTSLEQVLINLFSDKKVKEVVSKSVAISASCGKDLVGCTQISIKMIDKNTLDNITGGVLEYAKEKDSEDEKTAHC